MRIALVVMLTATVGASAALAQSASVTTGANGQLSGSTSVPGLPPISVTAGDGQVTTSGPVVDTWSHTNVPRGSPGHSVTVHSSDGSSSSRAWTSGDGAYVVAGSGSPGSTLTFDDARRDVGRGPRMNVADDRYGHREVRQMAYRHHHMRHAARRRHHHYG